MATDLGEKLAAAREGKKWSLREVERRTGIHNAHLSQIETGTIERPAPNVLWALAEVYDIDLQDLLRLAGHVEAAASRDTRIGGRGGAADHGRPDCRRAAPGLGVHGGIRGRDGALTRNIAADLARRQILAAAESALLKAGVAGVIPTPLDAVATAAEITEIIDISQLPPDIAARKPRAMRRILGALLHRERIAFVDLSQCEPRARLTEAHEIGHQIIPWHHAAFQLDDEERLLGNTRDQLETEAYLAGGHLIFQGQRFLRHALDYQVSIGTPIALAPDYGASRHATMRYYVLHHPDAVALLVAGRYLHRDGSVPIWTSVESTSFAAKFGGLADLMNGRLLIAGGTGKPARGHCPPGDENHRGRRQGDRDPRLARRPPGPRGRGLLQPAQPVRPSGGEEGRPVRAPHPHRR